jgi:hypothetical protein
MKNHSAKVESFHKRTMDKLLNRTIRGTINIKSVNFSAGGLLSRALFLCLQAN